MKSFALYELPITEEERKQTFDKVSMSHLTTTGDIPELIKFLGMLESKEKEYENKHKEVKEMAENELSANERRLVLTPGQAKFYDKHKCLAVEVVIDGQRSAEALIAEVPE